MGAFTEPRRILLGLLVPIGDTLFATPAIHGLRARFPAAHVTALAHRANREILCHNPDIDDLLVQGEHGALGFLAAVRRARFDLLVAFSTFSGWLAWLGGVAHRVELRPPPLWWLAPRRDSRWWDCHAVELYLDVVAPLGVEVSEPRLELHLGPEDRRGAAQLLEQVGVAAAVRGGRQLVALHPGGEGYHGRKRWPAVRFGALARRLHRDWNCVVLVLGGPEESELGRRVVEASAGTAITAVGRTRLLETAAILERSSAFVGNDSSLLHMASALGTPAVGIFGATNARNYRPWRGAYRVVAPPGGRACYGFVGTQPLWRDHLCTACPRMLAVGVDAALAQVVDILRVGRAAQRASAWAAG